MRIRSESGLIELSVLERLSEDLPSAGDVRVLAKIAGYGATGSSSSSWIEREVLQAFVEALHAINAGHGEEAELHSMSPGDLEIRVRLTDGAGHIRVTASVGRTYALAAGGNANATAGLSLDIDRSHLRGIVEGAVALGRPAGDESPRDDAAFVAPLLHWGLVQIRSLCREGRAEAAAQLADGLHNIPLVLSPTYWPQDRESYRIEIAALDDSPEGRACLTFAEESGRRRT